MMKQLNKLTELQLIAIILPIVTAVGVMFYFGVFTLLLNLFISLSVCVVDRLTGAQRDAGESLHLPRYFRTGFSRESGSLSM